MPVKTEKKKLHYAELLEKGKLYLGPPKKKGAREKRRITAINDGGVRWEAVDPTKGKRSNGFMTHKNFCMWADIKFPGIDGWPSTISWRCPPEKGVPVI